MWLTSKTCMFPLFAVVSSCDTGIRLAAVLMQSYLPVVHGYILLTPWFFNPKVDFPI